MDTATKHRLADELRTELTDCSAFVLVGFTGMTVAKANELRGKFRDAGCKYRVYKNSTIRFATVETQHAPIRDLLGGVSALAYNPADPGAPARVARDFAKDHDNFVIKGGISDGSLLDDKGVRALADLPGPLELKAMLLSLFNGPATSFVRVLNAPAQGLLNVLTARKDSLEGA
jgi:large subunit ribosomal protein L10